MEHAPHFVNQGFEETLISMSVLQRSDFTFISSSDVY